MSKISGFIGIESYDLLLYLSQTMKHLKCSVLLVDNSIDHSLAYTVPNFDEFSKLGIINYAGVDVAVGVSSEQLGKADYDYILIYFGFNQRAVELELCDEVYVITDLQLHNIFRLDKFHVAQDAYVFLVIRDKYSSKASPDLVLDSVKAYSIRPEDVMYIEDGPEDLNAKLMCQYNSRLSFKRVSKSICDFIVAVLGIDFDKKDVLGAYKMASRG